MMFESVETQLWVTKAVRQRIPSRRTRNSYNGKLFHADGPAAEKLRGPKSDSP